MNESKKDTTPIDDIDTSTRRTIFGGVGFNRFNGTDFDGAEVFPAMQGAFEQAMKQFPEAVYESNFLFSGQPVRIRVVGGDFAQHIVQPFAHLQNDKMGRRTPQLTIDLWDENATNIRCFTGSRGICRGWEDVTSMSPDGQYIGQMQPNTLTCFDRNTQHIVGCIAWSDQIPIYERAKPLSRLLLEWNNDRQIQVIHAGLVSQHGQGVLFVAKSGSGKSTTSLACLCTGFDYVGEDFIGLEKLRDGSFIGHSLYNSVFLETGHLAWFPQLSPYVIRGAPHEEKAVVILSHVFPERLARVATVRAVVLLRVAGESESRLQSISKSQALLALAPSSLIEIPSRGIDGFSRLAQLVEQVPTYALELGRDLESIPRRVDEIIAEVNRS